MNRTQNTKEHKNIYIPMFIILILAPLCKADEICVKNCTQSLLLSLSETIISQNFDNICVIHSAIIGLLDIFMCII